MKLNEEKLTDEALKQYFFDNLAKETKSLSSKQLATTFNSVSMDEIVRIVQNQERMYFLTKEEKEIIVETLKRQVRVYETRDRLFPMLTNSLDKKELNKKIKKINKLLDKLGE